MKKIFIVFLLCIFLSFLFLLFYKDEGVYVSNDTVKDEIYVSYNYEDNIYNSIIDDYVVGVVACEMPASFEIEALKSLSVASRTYTLNKLYSDSTFIFSNNNQCFNSINDMKDKWGNNYEYYYNRVKSAVYDTYGIVITYNNEPINALYYSISNGKTENSVNVFGGSYDYLVSVDSSIDIKYNYKSDSKSMSINEFCNKLNINSVSNISYERNESNRVNYVIIDNNRFKGTDIRKIFDLKSTDFIININNDNVLIETKGYGHGVGLSEYGANAYSLLGYDYEYILKHYYSGVSLEKLY